MYSVRVQYLLVRPYRPLSLSSNINENATWSAAVLELRVSFSPLIYNPKKNSFFINMNHACILLLGINNTLSEILFSTFETFYSKKEFFS